MLLISCLLSGCGPGSNTSSQTQSQAQATAYKNITRVQPAPAFAYSLPRALMIRLYRLEQHQVITWSVVQSPYTNKIEWECKSRGYPIPGGTQLTNPDKLVNDPNAYQSHSLVVPQQEPDGLFPPSTSEGTYVFCVLPDGQLAPVYEEKKVTTFPYPVIFKNGMLVPDPTQSATATIDVRAKIKAQHQIRSTGAAK